MVIEREADMTKQIACGDVVSGCSFTAAASDEKELMQKCRAMPATSMA